MKLQFNHSVIEKNENTVRQGVSGSSLSFTNSLVNENSKKKKKNGTPFEELISGSYYRMYPVHFFFRYGGFHD